MEWIEDRLPNPEDANEDNEVIAKLSYKHEGWSYQYWRYVAKGQPWKPARQKNFVSPPPPPPRPQPKRYVTQWEVIKGINDELPKIIALCNDEAFL